METWLQKVKRLLTFKHPKKLVIPSADPSQSIDNQPVWWGKFNIAEEQSRYFKIGSLVLCADRLNHQWHITSHKEGQKPCKSFAAQTTNPLLLIPTLPDRPLLTQLDRPFYIPAAETIKLYISVPLWIRIEAGQPPILLDEIVTEPLAESWFGKNTLEGELCYASRDQCCANIVDLLCDNTRAIIPISIKNHSHETLCLRDIKVPLPNLSLYRDTQNYLWTEQLNVYPKHQGTLETLATKGPPKPLKNINLVSSARLDLKSSLKNLFKWK